MYVCKQFGTTFTRTSKLHHHRRNSCPVNSTIGMQEKHIQSIVLAMYNFFCFWNVTEMGAPRVCGDGGVCMKKSKLNPSKSRKLAALKRAPYTVVPSFIIVLLQLWCAASALCLHRTLNAHKHRTATVVMQQQVMVLKSAFQSRIVSYSVK